MSWGKAGAAERRRGCPAVPLGAQGHGGGTAQAWKLCKCQMGEEARGCWVWWYRQREGLNFYVSERLSEQCLPDQFAQVHKCAALPSAAVKFVLLLSTTLSECALCLCCCLLQVIVFVPGELSTMAGRRLRRAVRSVLAPAWGADIKVTLTSYTNTYSSYATTYEEYQVQRYEGGSTLYGPYTMDAYIQASMHLAKALVAGQPVESTVGPPDFEHKLLRLLPPVVLDTVPPPHKFGDVIRQPRSDAPYHPGDVVEAVFWSANPRNNLRRGGTFLEVQFLDPTNGQWVIVYTDDDWSTKYKWDRPKGQMSSESTATVEWHIPEWTPSGTYRIKMYGDAKIGLAGPFVKSFEGFSQGFTVAGVQAH